MNYKEFNETSFGHTLKAFTMGSLIVVWWLCVWTIVETIFDRLEKHFKIHPLTFNIIALIGIFCFTVYLDPALIHHL